MNAASALSSLYFQAQSLPFSDYEAQDKQQQAPRQPTFVSKTKPNSSITILPAPRSNMYETAEGFDSSSSNFQALASPTSFKHDGFRTPKTKEEDSELKTASPSPRSFTGKRKRLEMDDDLSSFMGPTPKRKGSSDFLRKGQWTSTEERLARLLIEAFEEGYLPVYTGIRLRGYLAVQLQCDPMRVSKKLCAGTIDGKPVPKNFGQRKFKLRKKSLWDCEEAECRVTELETTTRAMWNEARMKKPSFLTLSTTRNVKTRGTDEDEEDSMSSPHSPARGRSPSSTPRAKKPKVFPIIYLNLSKKFKHYAYSSSSEPSSPSKESDSDNEPVRLDGESLQAAYDLLTLCSPRGTSRKGKSKRKAKPAKPVSIKDEEVLIKDEPAPVKDSVFEEKSETHTIKLEEAPSPSSIQLPSDQEVFIKDEPSYWA